MFIRTCQSCGHKQEDTDPQGNPTKAFNWRKCKKCKSADLDYGSPKSSEEETEDEDY